MANNRSFDVLSWSSLDLPYNKVARALSEEPRLEAGTNSYVTYGGTLAKRPGTLEILHTGNTQRCDRLWLYETLESPPKVYIVGSFYSGSTWNIQYVRLDAVSPAWTTAGSLRQLNASTLPHEAAVSRGKLYIKGYPSSGSGEKLGTVIFDGSGSGSPSTTYWGLLGPLTPARISGAINRISNSGTPITSSATSITMTAVTGYPAAPFNIQFDFEEMTVTAVVGAVLTVLRGAQGTTPSAHADQTIGLYRDWSASAHIVTVNLGWAYIYAYKSLTGHVSNRSAVETNPDHMPSNTGPFFNLIPKVIIQGQADTTNIPTIEIYRTTDGGGTWVLLEEIPNTGAGNITYLDDSLASGTGSTFSDPLPDTSLNTQSLAPSLTSNSPPPTVLAPLITGTDTPVSSTPIAYYQGRFWLGIGNYLFYSANEELNTGVPEEAWPSGFLGNFFLLQKPLANLEGTTDALYITTVSGDTYVLTGSIRETFNLKPVLKEIGSPYGHPRAISRYQDAMVWLTNDLRVAILQGDNFRVISDVLGADLVTAINAGAEMDIQYWADLEKEWLAISSIDKTTASNGRQWIYDVKKSASGKNDFWNAPWTVPATAVASGRIRESESQRRLIFYVWNGTNGFLSRIASLAAENVGTDALPTGATAYDFSITTALLMTPPGNHVNALRRPGMDPIVYEIIVDRTKYASDTDPTCYAYFDDTWSTPIALGTAQDTPRSPLPKGYNTLVYPILDIAHRVALRIDKLASTDLCEIQDLRFVFEPDKGM